MTEIQIADPSLVRCKAIAERIKGLFPNRASISQPIPHRKKPTWTVIYVDIHPELRGVRP